MPQSSHGSENSKHRLGKRLSKLLSNMLWHFNRSSPDFSTLDKSKSNHHSRHSAAKASSTMPTKTLHQPRRLRANSIRNRACTLMSIEEENETDLLPCK